MISLQHLTIAVRRQLIHVSNVAEIEAIEPSGTHAQSGIGAVLVEQIRRYVACCTPSR